MRLLPLLPLAFVVHIAASRYPRTADDRRNLPSKPDPQFENRALGDDAWLGTMFAYRYKRPK